jgi:hypothetical protein
MAVRIATMHSETMISISVKPFQVRDVDEYVDAWLSPDTRRGTDSGHPDVIKRLDVLSLHY